MFGWFKSKGTPAANDYVKRFTVPPGKSSGYYNQALSLIGRRSDLTDDEHRAEVEKMYNKLCKQANDPMSRSYRLPIHPDAYIPDETYQGYYDQAIQNVGPRTDLTDQQLMDTIFAEYDRLFQKAVWSSINESQSRIAYYTQIQVEDVEERRHQELLAAINSSNPANQALGFARKHPIITGALVSHFFGKK